MKRRQVLASTVAVLPLAGCLGAGDTDPDETTTANDTTTTTDGGTATNGFQGTDFEMVNAECAGEDATEASVTFGETEVLVEGTIVGNDACYVAKLDTVVYDEEASELSIVVESVREADDGTVCAQCITAIEYTLTARFRDALPERVLVTHRRNDTDERVADVQRS